jgi:hypothetical protein
MTERSSHLLRRSGRRLRLVRRGRLAGSGAPFWYHALRWSCRNQGREISFAPLCFGGAILLLLLFAWARPVDHDESQYVAAVALTPHLLPYRDFAFLQTPLHPFLFGPLAFLFEGHLWEALRTANALMAAAVLWLVYRSQRELGVGGATALLATALLAACDSFLFGAATARNDMLPALLESAAIWLLARSFARPLDAISAFLIGLLIAGAAAAKISYAVPLAAMTVVALLDTNLRGRATRWRWAALGVLLAALPVALLYLLYPEGFVFGVLRFPTVAPAMWYEGTGQAWKLGVPAKALDLTKFLALGPALVTTYLLARDVRRKEAAGGSNRLPCLYLDLLAAAGLVAAFLPSPVWRQYLIPALPPLFVRLGLIFEAERPQQRVLLPLLVSAAVGLAPSLLALVEAGRSGALPLAQATSEAHRIGGIVRAAGAEGTVAGLSPNYWVDSGLPLDPRFAAGPFVFRTKGLIPPREQRALHLISLDSYRTELRRHPPAVLITGGEPAPVGNGLTLDGALDRFATDNGYRRISAAGSRFTIYARD